MIQSQNNKTSGKRVLSLLLSAMVAFGGMTIPAAAETVSVETSNHTITNFEEIPEEVATRTVTLGTSQEELRLPETLSVTVTTGSALTVVLDSGDISDTEEPAEEETEATEPEETLSEATPSDSTPADEPEEEAVEEPKAEPTKDVAELVSEDISVTWTSDPAYDPETENTYIFTPTLPRGYALADGVSLPEISVTVGVTAPARLMMGIMSASTIDYVDENGDNHSVEATLIESDTTTLDGTTTDGWYYATGTVTLNSYLSVSGDVHLILTENSVLTISNPAGNTAGITVNAGNSLSIYADRLNGDSLGQLTATGAEACAGIGGGVSSSAGTITVNGGIIQATSGYDAAGIGGGRDGSGGTIIINGGTVTATSRSDGAGIGGGLRSSGGTITINGGTVNATGQGYGAGIGGGKDGGDSGSGVITINGGTVTALASGGGGAGIGCGELGSIDSVTINGGTVTATGASNGAGIGSSGTADQGGPIVITGGTVTATGGMYAPGIGARYDAGIITISGGTVTATAGEQGAGIGGGQRSSGGTVTISGTNTVVTATGSADGKDIGSGYDSSSGGTLQVSDGATLYFNSSGTNAATNFINCTVGGSGAGALSGTYFGRSITATEITISGLLASYAETGTAIEPVPTLIYTDSGEAWTLVEDVDYTLIYESSINPGVASLYIGGIGNYSGMRTASYQITETTLSGTLTLSTPPTYATSVQANVDTVTGILLTPTYQWYRDSAPISGATDSAYTPTVEDLDTALSVTLTSDPRARTISSTPQTVVRAAQAAPASITGGYASADKTFTYTVTAPVGAGIEYSKDGSTWQTSPVFTGFAAGDTAQFRARMAETSTHLAGSAAETALITFMRLEFATPPTLNYTVSGTNANRTVTITPVTGAEYQFNSDGWSSTNTRSGLSSAETVTIAIRYAQTATYNASGPSSASINLSKQNHPQTPESFTLSSAYQTTDGQFIVTIPEQADAEYSFDGTVYGAARTLAAAPGATVTAYVRYPETELYNASIAAIASLALPGSVLISSAGDATGISQPGGTLQLSASVLPSSANQTVLWSIASGSGATVDSTGLVTATSNGSVTIRAAIPDASSIYADFPLTISGQGGSSCGSSTSSVTQPYSSAISPALSPNQPTAVSVSATPKVENGNATLTITDSMAKIAIEKALADAKTKGNTANGISVDISVTATGSTAFALTLERAALNRLLDAGIKAFSVSSLPVNLSFDTKALKQLQAQSSSDLIITVKPVTVSGLRNAFDITLSAAKDGKTVNITSLGTGAAILGISTEPGKNEFGGCLYGAYVDANNQIKRIADSAYDANSGRMMFSTNHFSVYGVGYAAPIAKFTDISSHWGKDSIDYVVGRGLLSGTSDTTFTPNTAMTRAMLVTALGRLAGVDAKAYTTSSFTDVKEDAYYQPYIEWAYQKGIVQGTGSQQFSPDRAVTREEIAVIFANFAKATGYTLPVTRTATTYADADSIGNVYKTAITAMQQAGIMMGGSGNKFNPKANATRAEVSTMLHRYIKLTVDPATAQSWALNDAGQYLYYKDGKALTGTQTIDGVKYFFNSDGTLKTGWVQDGDNWRYYAGNKLLVGWQNMGSGDAQKTYYFDTYGNMASGKWLQIDGKWYYFNADGALARSTTVDGYEVDNKGVRKTK